MSPPLEILRAWCLEDSAVTPITTGLINQTYLVQNALSRVVLQQLNPIFGPEVNEDIEAITDKLAAAGLETPRLVRTSGDQLWCSDGQGSTWRALSYMEGDTIQRVEDPQCAHSAGRLLGRFHRALWDLDYTFRHQRVGVHDTQRHLTHLERALKEGQDHPAYRQVEPLAREILAAAGQLQLPAALPSRNVHGDPKITNIIFAPGGEARCMVDLDTLARMPLCLEMGDALRSWCNPAGEEEEGELDLDLVKAGLEGYAEALGPGPEQPERDALPGSVELISVELAARFCADTLEEHYFGWDDRSYASAWEHNLVRTRSQLALARSARELHSELRAVVDGLWSTDAR